MLPTARKKLKSCLLLSTETLLLKKGLFGMGCQKI